MKPTKMSARRLALLILFSFYTMKQPALMFGPDKNGDFLYFWLSKDGNIGYLGYSFMTSMIKGKYNDPVFPAEEDFGDNTAKYVCYQSDVLLMQKQLKESLEGYYRLITERLVKKGIISEVAADSIRPEINVTGEAKKDLQRDSIQ